MKLNLCLLEILILTSIEELSTSDISSFCQDPNGEAKVTADYYSIKYCKNSAIDLGEN